MSYIKKQLPEGWVESKIGDIVSLSRDRAMPPFDNSTKYIGLEHIEPYTSKILNYANADIVKSAKMKFESGDVLYGKLRPYLSKVCIPTFSGICSTDILVFKAIVCFDSRYLMNYFKTPEFIAFSSNNMSGVQLPRISSKKLFEYTIPVAPLAEQKRITHKLEKKLTSINKIKEQLDNIPNILKRFRRSVLSDAITGKLTQALRNKNKFQYDDNEQTSIFNIDLPTGWKKIKIKDFTSKVGSGSTPKGGQRVYISSGTPLIRSQNISFEGFLEDGLVFINQKHAKKLTNVEIQENDVLLNITGASIGRVTTAPKSMNGARVNQHVCIIRPNKLIQPSFLSYFLTSPEMQDYIMQSQYGVTRQALTKAQILDFQVPLPNEEEQKEIINRIDSLFKLADSIENRYQNAIIKINEAGQNILTKAFRGELVATEAELAEREGRSYETAEELLKRIKLERERLSTHKTKRRIMKKTKNKTQDITADKLAAVLLRSQVHKLSPDELFGKAGFDENSVDQFYELLRECVVQERIVETRTKDNRILLEGVK